MDDRRHGRGRAPGAQKGEGINDLNHHLITHSETIAKICASVSDETAHVLLELARALTDSPLGYGDGNVIYAQRLLEKRLDVNRGKTVIVAGSTEFHKLIADVGEVQAAQNVQPAAPPLKTSESDGLSVLNGVTEGND